MFESIFETAKRKPLGYGDPMMMGTFAACCQYAIAEEKTLAQFRKDTGCNWTPSRAPIERMVDNTTGAAKEFCEKFVVWAAENLWGIEGDTEVEEGQPKPTP